MDSETKYRENNQECVINMDKNQDESAKKGNETSFLIELATLLGGRFFLYIYTVDSRYLDLAYLE